MIHQPTQPQYRRGNTRSKTNHRIFAISLIILQLIVSFLYGYCANIQITILNLNSVFSAILLAFLSVVGFGMYFGYLKSLLWTSIGFSVLIVALSIQVYPLVNALLAKGNIYTNQVYSDSFKDNKFVVSLANIDSSRFQGNNITSSIKSGLAIIIGFGSLIGRIGPLECLLMTTFGTIGYQLNRNIIISLGQDVAGTFSIFTFGGFLGLTFGAVMAIRQKNHKAVTFQHPMLCANIQTIGHSIIGVLFIFILFPFLAYEGDQSLQAPFFQRYISPVSVLLSMGSSTISSFGTGLLIHGDKSSGIRTRDVMNSVIAGGIISGAASFYITTPFEAIIVGSIAGISQFIFDNYLEKMIYAKLGHISSSSYTLFCLQGFLGAVFAAGYNIRMRTQNNGFPAPQNLKNGGWEMAIYLISAGFGIGFGLIVGAVCYFLNQYKTEDMFTDRAQFMAQDGIQYFIQKKKVDAQTKIIQHKDSDNKNLPQQKSQPSQIPSSSSQPPSSITDLSFGFVDMLQVTIQ